MTEFIPRTDDFSRGGSLPYLGDGLVDYAGARPNTTGFKTGILADFDNDGLPYASDAAGSDAGGPCGFQWRRPFVADCDVEARFQLALDANPFNLNTGLFMRRFGVLARITNGTLQDSDDEEQRLEDLTCYAAYLRMDPPPTGGVNGAVGFRLSRFDAGTETILFQNTSPIPLLDPSLNLRYTEVHGLGLQVVNVGGFVVLSPRIRRLVVNTSLLSDVDWSIVGLSGGVYVDTSASRITDAGRAGFIQSTAQETDLGGGFLVKSRHKVVSFEVRDFTGGTDQGVVLRDEFAATQPNAGEPKTSVYGTTGPSYQYGYTSTLFGQGNTTIPAQARSSADVAYFNLDFGDNDRAFCVARRTPDDPRRQTPNITFTINTLGAFTGPFDRRGAGVIVHGSGWSDTAGVPGSGAFTGYVAWCYWSSTDAHWVLWLERYINGVPTLLGALEDALPGITSAGQIDLELEAGPIPGSPDQDGPVRMEVRAGVAGLAARTLVLEPVPDLAADGSYIIDLSTSRITQGFEGFGGIGDSANTNVHVESYGQGTLLDPGVAPEDAANVALGAEDDGATGSLNTVCRVVFPQVLTNPFRTRTHDFDSGHQQRLVLDDTERARWENLQTFPMDQTAADAFWDFWNDHRGNEIPFSFTDERTGTTHTVRFVDSELQSDRLFKDVVVFRFDLEEVMT